MKKKKVIEKKTIEAPKPDLFAFIAGTATLVLPVWVVVSGLYYFGSLLSFPLSSYQGWIWGIACGLSIVMLFWGWQKWIQVFYLLKPGILTIFILLWHLTIFFTTKTVVLNLAIGIFSAIYIIHRCEIMQLKNEDIDQEAGSILKKNNNALYGCAAFYFWVNIKTTSLMDTLNSYTGMGFWPNVIIAALLFLVAVFGFVRLQYVIATNIVVLHFHPERIQK